MTSNADERGATARGPGGSAGPLPDPAAERPNAAFVALPSPQAFIDEALAAASAAAGDMSASDARTLAIYQHAFPLGEKLADLLTRRALGGQRRLGLAALIEDILRIPTPPFADDARRALFAGLCWRLEHLIALGGHLLPELALARDDDTAPSATMRVDSGEP